MATAPATKRCKLPQRESPKAAGTSDTERAAGRVVMPTSPATAKRTATKRAATSTAMCRWAGSASVLASRRKLSGGVELRLLSRLISWRARRSCCGDLRSGVQLLRSRMTRYLPCCTDADFNGHPPPPRGNIRCWPGSPAEAPQRWSASFDRAVRLCKALQGAPTTNRSQSLPRNTGAT